ncbi:MAG: caspase family protein, partial [Pseudomonadales bacterium]|nr:caspase family protein [Pseudomonadales bacterium]
MFKKITQALSISLLIMYASAAEAKRVALIVGNAAYKNENVLSNPINDARLIAKTLQNDLGFDDVKIIENADMRSLNRAVDEFGRKANGADAAFVYFSGHGLQTTDKQNYLLAVDAQIEQESDIKVSAITSEALVEATEGAKIRLVVLDACRDRPNSVYKTKSATKGLTRAKDPSINGLLIAYATEDGKVAQDGRSGGNSPYAAALVAELKKRDKPIMAMFDEVMESVVKQTNGTQKPTRSGDLTVKMYLVDPVIIPAVAISTVDSEKEFWDEVKNSTTANDYAAYLEQYPKGRFMVLAR